MTSEEYYLFYNGPKMSYEEYCKYFIPTTKKAMPRPSVSPPKTKKPKIKDFSRQKEKYKEANDLPTTRFEKFKRDNNLPDEIDLRC